MFSEKLWMANIFILIFLFNCCRAQDKKVLKLPPLLKKFKVMGPSEAVKLGPRETTVKVYFDLAPVGELAEDPAK